jgi:hypothetical protein
MKKGAGRVARPLFLWIIVAPAEAGASGGNRNPPKIPASAGMTVSRQKCRPTPASSWLRDTPCS